MGQVGSKAKILNANFPPNQGIAILLTQIYTCDIIDVEKVPYSLCSRMLYIISLATWD